MKEIIPGIFVERQYPPYNVGLIRLEETLLAVDIPPRPADAHAWRAAIEQQHGPIRYAILTDGQPERLVAATFWPDIPLIAHRDVPRYITKLEEREWQELVQEVAAQHPEVEAHYFELAPHRVTLAFEERFTYQRHEPHLEFQAVDGIAPGALWIYLAKFNLIFAGDTVVLEEPQPLEHTPDSHALLNTLSTLANRNTIQQVVPGRGPELIDKAEIEPLREFVRVMRRTARSLARGQVTGADFTHAAQDIAQTFFPHTKRSDHPMQKIRRGLHQLVAELQNPEEEEADEAE